MNVKVFLITEDLMKMLKFGIIFYDALTFFMDTTIISKNEKEMKIDCVTTTLHEKTYKHAKLQI